MWASFVPPVYLLTHFTFLVVYNFFFLFFIFFFRQSTRLFKKNKHLTSLLPIERYISSFMFDVPLPPRGRTKVQVRDLLVVFVVFVVFLLWTRF